MIMSNKLYDTLKYIFTIILPALAVLYVALAGIWNLPYADKVSATIAAIVTFANTVLAINSIQYKNKMRGENQND